MGERRVPRGTGAAGSGGGEAGRRWPPREKVCVLKWVEKQAGRVLTWAGEGPPSEPLFWRHGRGSGLFLKGHRVFPAPLMGQESGVFCILQSFACEKRNTTNCKFPN